MINSNKVKGRIKECGLSQEDVAKHLNIASCTVSQKLNNVRPFDLEEAEKLATLLKIDSAEFGDYFFAH